MLRLTLDSLQWLGCLFGISGALLLALNNRRSGLGFILYLVSNGFWVLYAISIKSDGLLMMQCIYTVTSVIGIYRWMFSQRRIPDIGVITQPSHNKHYVKSN